MFFCVSQRILSFGPSAMIKYIFFLAISHFAMRLFCNVLYLRGAVFLPETMPKTKSSQKRLNIQIRFISKQQQANIISATKQNRQKKVDLQMNCHSTD